MLAAFGGVRGHFKGVSAISPHFSLVRMCSFVRILSHGRSKLQIVGIKIHVHIKAFNVEMVLV